MVASDSVFMWTNDDGSKSFIDIIAAVRQFMLVAVYSGITPRGAITRGPLSASFTQVSASQINIHNAIFGRAIVGAYEMERQQQWAGCLVCRDCVERFDQIQQAAASQADIPTSAYLIEKGLLRQYPVPYKSGAKTEFVVDWVSANQGGVQEDAVRKSFEMHNKSLDRPGAREKVENTVQFVRTVNAAKAR